jgi:hypothetical protein
MVLIGHKKLETTQKYMHLLNLNEEEWASSGATTAKEATQLIESGFQYVTTIEGIQLFRKTQVTAKQATNTLFFPYRRITTRAHRASSEKQGMCEKKVRVSFCNS